MALDNNFFNKVEEKTKVNKDTIISLARKLQDDSHDETTIREVINTLSNITNKKLPEESINKIVDIIKSDKVPKNIDKMF